MAHPCSAPLTISDLAAATGVSDKAIRYYEGVGVLPPAVRDRSGYRVYESADVERVAFVRAAQLAGLPLREIAVLTAARDGALQTAEAREVIAEARARVGAARHRLEQLHDELMDLSRAATRQ